MLRDAQYETQAIILRSPFLTLPRARGRVGRGRLEGWPEAMSLPVAMVRDARAKWPALLTMRAFNMRAARRLQPWRQRRT